jgi:hypothetical protein
MYGGERSEAMEIEVWAEPEQSGWTVGLTNHSEGYVSMVREGLSEEDARAYRDRLVVLALDLAGEEVAG